MSDKMLVTKPLGPRSKSARNLPPLTLPFGPSPPANPDPLPTTTPAQSFQQTTETSSSNHSHNCETPLFLPTTAKLNVQRRPNKPGLGQLHINVGPGIKAGDERTIRPEETFSPERTHRRPRLAPPITARKNTGELPPVFAPSYPVVDPLEDLRDAVKQISISHSGTPSSSGSPENSSTANTSPGSIAAGGLSHKVPLEFSDDLLEVQERLGEGAGGAVHKVQDKREPGMVYARKTITTREVAVRQVVRELNIISTTSHVNIVQCFGAYMSPSSSEVKIIMEYCEGGSLEAIGKKMKESGAIVGEKIAGRIAEGVSNFNLFNSRP